MMRTRALRTSWEDWVSRTSTGGTLKEALRSWNIRRARRRNDKEPNDYLFLDTQKDFLDTLCPVLSHQFGVGKLT